MLAQHELTPFLTEEEAKGMREFTASTSWGRKIVHKFGWKTVNSAAGAATADGADTQQNAEYVDNADTLTPYNPLLFGPLPALGATAAGKNKKSRSIATTQKKSDGNEEGNSIAQEKNERSRVACSGFGGG